MKSATSINEFSSAIDAIDAGIIVKVGKSSCKRGGYKYSCPATYMAVTKKDGTATMRMFERHEDLAHTYKADHLTDVEIEELAGDLGVPYELRSLHHDPA